MKKRITTLLLVLVLCVGLATPAYADYYIEYPHLEIGQKFATTFAPEDNPALSKNVSGQGWSWNAATYTLTLDNVNQPTLSLSIVDPTKPVTIEVKGNNTMYGLSEGMILSTKDVTITLTGSGTLNLTGWGGVDVVDGPTVISAESFRFDTLKSGSVTIYYPISYGIYDVQGGYLILDTREYYKEHASKDEDYKQFDSAVSGSTNNLPETIFQGCTLTDENGAAVTMEKRPVIFSSGNIFGYKMVAVKADGSCATYVKVRAPGSTPFSDVKASDYFAAPVIWAVDEGITNGTSATTFSPNSTCTRGQIITFLWRAAGSPEPKNLSAFTDVNPDLYYAKATAWAKENGMASGSTFSPDAPCTREMAVEFMWKLAGSPSAPAASFTDVSSGAVNWAVEKGVTNGTSATTFSPNSTCTRGQIVTFLYRGFAD